MNLFLVVGLSLVASVQSDRWTRVADMPAARSAHAVVATANAIYALGGTGGQGTPVLEVDRFDGSAWSREGTIPGEGLNAPAAAAIGDDIYLIGGFGTTTNQPTAKVHRYNTTSKIWTEAAPLPAPRGGHAAVVLNGRIHVIGGGNSVSTIDDHTVYDPKTNTWSERAKLPRRMGSPAAVVYDGKLYSIGGRSGLEDFGDVHVYDPTTDTWKAGPAIGPRGTAGAVTFRGRIYLFGGESQPRQTVLGDVFALTSGASEWRAVSQLPKPRNYARAVVFNDAVYIVGGSLQFGASHSSRGSVIVERYDEPRR